MPGVGVTDPGYFYHDYNKFADRQKSKCHAGKQMIFEMVLGSGLALVILSSIHLQPSKSFVKVCQLNSKV